MVGPGGETDEISKHDTLVACSALCSAHRLAPPPCEMHNYGICKSDRVCRYGRYAPNLRADEQVRLDHFGVAYQERRVRHISRLSRQGSICIVDIAEICVARGSPRLTGSIFNFGDFGVWRAISAVEWLRKRE